MMRKFDERQGFGVLGIERLSEKKALEMFGDITKIFARTRWLSIKRECSDIMC